MAGKEMIKPNTSSSTQPAAASNSQPAQTAPLSQPTTNTSKPSVLEALRDGLLKEEELTKRQRGAMRGYKPPPQLTEEQLKIIEARKVKDVASQKDDSAALNELKGLIAEGLLAQEHLSSGQATALQSGSTPPPLSEGQEKMVNAMRATKAAKTAKEAKRLEEETKPISDKSDIDDLRGVGLPYATLRKLVDDGLITTSQLSQKQKRALTNGWQASPLNEGQLKSMKKRLEKLKAQQQKSEADRGESVQVEDNITATIASSHVVPSKASSSHANEPGPSGTSFVDPAVNTSSVQTRSMSQSAGLHTELPSSSKATTTVFNPTDQYMQQAAAEPIRLKSPQPLLIISDLNGTLANKKKTKSGPPSFRARPGLHPFLCYVLNLDIPTTNPYERVPRTSGKDFSFMVWTSARPENAKIAVETLFTPSTLAKVKAVWGRDTLGLSEEQYYEKVQVYKTLQTVWDDPQVQSWHPDAEEGGKWNQSNTVLIDDSPVKATTEPYNHIQVPELVNKRLEAELDAWRKARAKPGTAAWDDPHNWRTKEKARRVPRGVLASVADYLEQARWYHDVSAYIRSNKFEMPEIDAKEVKVKDAEGPSLGSNITTTLKDLYVDDVEDIDEEEGGVPIPGTGDGGVDVGKGKGKKLD